MTTNLPLKPRRRTAIGGALLGLALFTCRAEARVTKLVITRTESPTFQGMAFGQVGPYEKLVGRATGEVDPRDPGNALIADIALAPRNAKGLVEYSTDVFILRPVDRSRGNHRIFFEVNNRGRLLSLAQLNDAPAEVNDPTTTLDAGNGFLMRQGYTIVLSGWDVTVAQGAGRFAMTVPIARQPDGRAIVGHSLEEFVIDNTTPAPGSLTYPAASLERTEARLTVRTLYSDPPMPIASTGWEYVNDRTIRLLPEGTLFQNGRLYELVYPAKDPLVAGLAFAGLRDLVSYFRYRTADDERRPNPLEGDASRVISFAVSQPTRFMRDFLHLGFNEDEQGRLVFDGMLNWIGGASGGFFNYRFAQPGRTHRQRIGRWFPEFEFPFANNVTLDPITGKTDGRLRRCLASKTCPKVFEVNSENEYWAKAMSLLHTDTSGHDLPDPPNVRSYLLASLPHSTGIAPAGKGICQQPRNPILANPTLRALLVAMDAWVSGGQEPPPSRLPRRSDGTLVPVPEQAGRGFPAIPGVTYNGRLHEGNLFDFGSSVNRGIVSVVPPILLKSPYPVFVPKTDGDGNDVAGVRVVEVAVPLATYTGWALRSGPAAGDGCDAAGQQIAFSRTKADRLSTGDPRLSIEERYASHEDYAKQVTDAATALQRERFLLEEDVKRYVTAAAASDVGR